MTQFEFPRDDETPACRSCGQASVDLGSLADAAKPHTPHEVDRSTVFTTDAPAKVLQDDLGNGYSQATGE